jgi:hypothetical protein
MSVARQFWRNRKTTRITSTMACHSVPPISFIPSVTGRVGVEGDLVVEVAGEAFLELGDHRLDAVGDLEGVGAGRLEGGDQGGGAAVEAAGLVVPR